MCGVSVSQHTPLLALATTTRVHNKREREEDETKERRGGGCMVEQGETQPAPYPSVSWARVNVCPSGHLALASGFLAPPFLARWVLPSGAEAESVDAEGEGRAESELEECSRPSCAAPSGGSAESEGRSGDASGI